MAVDYHARAERLRNLALKIKEWHKLVLKEWKKAHRIAVGLDKEEQE